jgi:protoheme IX farnesyltransferase
MTIAIMKLHRTLTSANQSGAAAKPVRIETISSRSSRSRHVAFLQLTKPKVMLLVLVTGATALILEGSFLAQPHKLIFFLLGLYMTGGAANAFNQYFERDIDARMTRTMSRRPLPLGQISNSGAVVFSCMLGLLGVILLGLFFNLLTAMLSLGTMLFYSLVYTLWLKPNTPHNIVVGGIAGAMAPVGAWAAATGSVTLTPMILFLLVFLWTPPHFWALALCFRDDYKRAGLPMLPVVKGIDSTLRQMMLCSYLLVSASLLYSFDSGHWFYTGAAIILGAVFIYRIRVARHKKDHKAIWGVFKFSIIYLFGLFSAMVVDKIFLGGG